MKALAQKGWSSKLKFERRFLATICPSNSTIEADSGINRSQRERGLKRVVGHAQILQHAPPPQDKVRGNEASPEVAPAAGWFPPVLTRSAESAMFRSLRGGMPAPGGLPTRYTYVRGGCRQTTLSLGKLMREICFTICLKDPLNIRF